MHSLDTTGQGAPAASAGALLEDDHRRLDELLGEAKRLVKEGALAEAASPFRAFRVGLERHIEAEEQVLFPAFEELARQAGEGAAPPFPSPGGGPVAVMRTEHEALRKGMAEVAERLEAGDREGLTTPLAALTARILAHNGKEERILYPATDRLLDEAGRSEAVLREVQALL